MQQMATDGTEGPKLSNMNQKLQEIEAILCCKERLTPNSQPIDTEREERERESAEMMMCMDVMRIRGRHLPLGHVKRVCLLLSIPISCLEPRVCVCFIQMDENPMEII